MTNDLVTIGHRPLGTIYPSTVTSCGLVQPFRECLPFVLASYNSLQGVSTDTPLSPGLRYEREFRWDARYHPFPAADRYDSAVIRFPFLSLAMVRWVLSHREWHSILFRQLSHSLSLSSLEHWEQNSYRARLGSRSNDRGAINLTRRHPRQGRSHSQFRAESAG